jgi:hypothetical protein
MQVRVSKAGVWAKYPDEPLGWSDVRVRWKSQPGRRVRTMEFTIEAISELQSQIELDRQLAADFPEERIYVDAIADGEAILKRLLAGEEGVEQRGVEYCLLIPKTTATRADAEAAITHWFRRNGEARPIRYHWEKMDWFAVPATLRA